MSDLNTIIKAMSEAEQTSAADNSYLKGAGLFDEISAVPLAMKQASPNDYGLGETIGTAAASSLLSGIFEGIGSRQVQDDQGNFFKGLLKAAEGESIDDLDLSSKLKSKALNYGSLFGLQRQLEGSSRAHELESKVYDAMLDDPSLKRDLATRFKSKILGEPEEKEGFQAFSRERDLLNADDKAIVDYEDKIRKEIESSAPGTAIAAAAASLPTLRKMADIDTSSSDIPFIYKFIQAQDGGVVKQGEFDTVAASNSVLAKWKGILDKRLAGGSELTPKIKRQMVSEMVEATAGQWEALKLFAKDRQQRVVGMGGKPNAILPYSEEFIASTLRPLAEYNQGGGGVSGNLAQAAARKLAERKAAREKSRNDLVNLGAIPQ